MKIRFFSDPHHDHERPSHKPQRHSDKSLGLVKTAAMTTPPGFDALICGGDFIERNRFKTRAHHENLCREFGNTITAYSPVPVHGVLGNHEYDYFEDAGVISELTGLRFDNYFIDTPTRHRIIFLNDKFHCPCDKILLPYSAGIQSFLYQSLQTAPTKAVTVVIHTPLAEFDIYKSKIVMRDQDEAFTFRPNTAALREILEGSGKHILVISGHSHYEDFSWHNNVAYLTVQSLVEAVHGQDQEMTYNRWADIERPNDDALIIRLHGYKGYEISHRFTGYRSAPSLDDDLLLAAE